MSDEEMKSMDDVRERVKHLRDEKGYSWRDVAGALRAGISPSTARRIYAGQGISTASKRKLGLRPSRGGVWLSVRLPDRHHGEALNRYMERLGYDDPADMLVALAKAQLCKEAAPLAQEIEENGTNDDDS